MKKKRKSPADLVKAGSAGAHGKKWAETLNDQDWLYVKRTAAAMREVPNAAPYHVARLLKEEIKATASVNTIARTLKELIANG